MFLDLDHQGIPCVFNGIIRNLLAVDFIRKVSEKGVGNRFQ